MPVSSCSLDTAEDLYKVSKEKIIRYAIESQLSLAVPLFVVGMSKYRNLKHESYDLNHFDHCGDYRFIYVISSWLEINKDIILSSGEIAITSLVNFNKSPVGHPDHGFSKDAFRVDFGNDYYERWWHETNKSKTTPVYLTKDAILNTPIKSIFNINNFSSDNNIVVTAPKTYNSYQGIDWNALEKGKREIGLFIIEALKVIGIPDNFNDFKRLVAEFVKDIKGYKIIVERSLLVINEKEHSDRSLKQSFHKIKEQIEGLLDIRS